jgi:hypothetical protein
LATPLLLLLLLLHLLLCASSWAEEHCLQLALDAPPAG